VSAVSGDLLVTGASGFLGSTIVDLACNVGWNVRALSRNPRIANGKVETFAGDIADMAVLRRASEGVKSIVHAAGLAHVFGPGARDSVRFDAVNEAGTCNVIDAALECGVPHVVLVSSVSVYGGYSGTKCDETMPCQPRGPYAISKWRSELRAAQRMARGRNSLTILRFATIYGEDDRGNVARLIRALDCGRFVWLGSGGNQKSLIHKKDAARACLCALVRPAPGVEIFNVSAQPVTMREIVTTICHALGRPVPHLSIPLTLLKVAGSISRKLGDPGDLDQQFKKFTHDDVYDGTRFESFFDFCPSVSLSEGIRREVDSLRKVQR
jgi:nucleoside-diphosphate-sugar epimerase